MPENCRAVKQRLLNLGAEVVEDLPKQIAVAGASTNKFLLALLPRGKKYKPLVSEFGTYVQFVAFSDEHNLQQQLEAVFPKDFRICSRRLKQWGQIRDGCEGDDWKLSNSVAEVRATMVDNAPVEVCQVGLPREPLDFVEEARRKGHPRTFALHLPEVVRQVLDENILGNPLDLARTRIQFLWTWTQRTKELSVEEKSFKQRLPPHMAELLKMLSDLKYPDAHLAEDIAAGFPLTGWMRESGVFPKVVKRPQYDVGTLKKLATGLNRSIMKQLESVPVDDEDAVKAWEQTKAEIELGYVWIDGDASSGSYVLAKRLLPQKNKTRVIDDCTVGGLNQSLGSVEKYKIHTLDEIAAHVVWMLGRTVQNRHVKLVGRTYDLTAAYKQFGVSSFDRDLLRIAVKDTDANTVRLLGVNSLPFGASGSVGGFLIWYIGLVGLRLAWTAYFDDYTNFSAENTASNAEGAITGLFNLLGLDFAQSGDKALKYSTKAV